MTDRKDTKLTMEEKIALSEHRLRNPITDEERVAIYEKYKMRNFIASCKLEGIDLTKVDPDATLEEVIAKYKVKPEVKDGN